MEIVSAATPFPDGIDAHVEHAVVSRDDHRLFIFPHRIAKDGILFLGSWASANRCIAPLTTSLLCPALCEWPQRRTCSPPVVCRPANAGYSSSRSPLAPCHCGESSVSMSSCIQSRDSRPRSLWRSSIRDIANHKHVRQLCIVNLKRTFC